MIIAVADLWGVGGNPTMSPKLFQADFGKIAPTGIVLFVFAVGSSGEKLIQLMQRYLLFYPLYQAK